MNAVNPLQLQFVWWQTRDQWTFPFLSLSLYYHFQMVFKNLISPLIHACRVGLLFCRRPPVEGHMMLLCFFVIFCIWLQGRGPNSKLNGVFVQHGSSPKRVSALTAASNEVVKMFEEAQRQHIPPGSSCLPGARRQIIYSRRRHESVWSGKHSM